MKNYISILLMLLLALFLSIYASNICLSQTRSLDRSISMYPSPVSNLLTISSYLIPLTKVTIYSLLGKKVKVASSDFNGTRMDNRSSGVYIVRIQSENGLTIKEPIEN